jgi:hypothetical protein
MHVNGSTSKIHFKRWSLTIRHDLTYKMFITLRQLINHVSSYTNALQALNLQATMHDLISNNLLLSVLDTETHKEWELHSSKMQDLSSTKEITEFLKDRCKAMELLQANQATTTASTRTAQHTGSKLSQPFRCYLTTQLQCLSCKVPHGLYHCNKFPQVATTTNIWACKSS